VPRFSSHCRLVKGTVANQLGRALYFMLKNGTAFDREQLIA